MAEVATAYLYRSAAHTCGNSVTDRSRFRYRRIPNSGAKVRDAWRAEFIDVDGTIQRATQANLARAITFGLVTVAESERVAAELVKRIREAGTTIGTGFLATPFLLPVLADHGHVDVAFDLLLQTRAPSWLNMIEAGSTTVWENWEGLDKNGQGSLNHYSKGAVITFLHQYVAGLRPYRGGAGLPAFRGATSPWRRASPRPGLPRFPLWAD